MISSSFLKSAAKVHTFPETTNTFSQKNALLDEKSCVSSQNGVFLLVIKRALSLLVNKSPLAVLLVLQSCQTFRECIVGIVLARHDGLACTVDEAHVFAVPHQPCTIAIVVSIFILL